MISLLSVPGFSALAHPASLTAVTIAVAAFGLLLSTKGLPSLTSLHMTAVDPERERELDLPTPHDAHSIGELERLFRRLSQPENQTIVYRRFAERAGLTLTAREMWLLQRLAEIVGATENDLATALRIDSAALAKPLAALQNAGLVTSGDDSLCLTDEGRTVLAKMQEARKLALEVLFSEWAPGGHYEIHRILDRFTRTLNAEMPPEEQIA